MTSLVTPVLVTAVMAASFFSCTMALLNFTLLSVGAAVTLTFAFSMSDALPLSSKALKPMDRSPAPLNA